jgi:probable HAF family extracellular repeat protein
MLDGKVQDLGTLSGTHNGFARAINANNEVTGGASIGAPIVTGVVAFVWTSANGMKALPGLGGSFTVSFAINNSGTVVGNAVNASGNRHPVLWNPKGAIRDLGTLPGGFGSAFGVNSLNQVVGYSTISSGTPHAFIWSAQNGMKDLNDLIPPNSGWVLVWASAINRAGEIAGYGTINGENHAYLLTPQP